MTNELIKDDFADSADEYTRAFANRALYTREQLEADKLDALETFKRRFGGAYPDEVRKAAAAIGAKPVID
jgi:hypothetical protein